MIPSVSSTLYLERTVFDDLYTLHVKISRPEKISDMFTTAQPKNLDKVTGDLVFHLPRV